MEQITDRKTAMAAGQLRYFTGTPCKNGHTSDRYTRNGACISCLRVNNEMISEARALAPNEKRDTLAKLVKMGMRIYHLDYPRFSELVVAMVRAHYPTLTPADVTFKGKFTGDAAGTGFYPFMVREDDVAMLRTVAAAYCTERSGNHLANITARLTQAAEAAGNDRDNGVGEWKFT